MRHTGALLLIACLYCTACFHCTSAIAADVDYVRDVKPLLEKHCYSCHSGLRAKSGLRVDHLSFLREGGFRGPAIAETAADSPLFQALGVSDDIEQMPLESKPLSDEQIALVKAWIEAGAPAPDEPLPEDPIAHWSFQNPRRAELPEIKDTHWAAHPIDRFIASSHEREQLEPAPQADKNLLLRRLYLDLIGLPPTPQELQAFVADTSDDAYEKVVDRLLASPRYGERWGRHWMDVWRYSDWDGFGKEVRESQPHVWRWRDWIVESLNADKPYDQMIVEMLAADEVAPLDADAQRATGFLARNWYKFNRNAWLDNTVEHTAKAFLGVTLNCARCHDHMYDPLLQTDYYQFRAIFEPHEIRTDRVAGQSDTMKDGLVHAFDAKAETPTFLFARGNEASPDKDHPLTPGVPAALGGDAFQIAAVSLPAEAYYPGLRQFVREEAIAAATAKIARTEQAMNTSNEALAGLRKQQADLLAASATPKPAESPVAGNGTSDKPAEQPAAEKPTSPPADELDDLKVTLASAEKTVSLSESELLAAAANLVAVRAKIAADDARFGAPPREDAESLAREAYRAEQIANAEQSKFDVLKAEHVLAAAQTDIANLTKPEPPAEANAEQKPAEGESGEAAPEVEKTAEEKAAAEKAEKDRAAKLEAAKKRATEAKTRLEAVQKQRETHQAKLGTADDKYTHFGEVYPETSTGRRAALAQWIASKNNPLTARMAINQIWMRHFGSPLVASVFDFGRHGEEPTHPELLDWLAVELMEGQWRMKPIHRLIVTSQTYRMQSAATNEQNLARDPENRYLWHANPRRMEAEILRDSTLHLADALDVTMGGADLDENSGMTVPRRSLYFRSSKEKKMTFLETFDRANVTDCYRRSETVVPQQALAMVNSSLSLAQSRRLAGTLSAEVGSETLPAADQAFVGAAFERILCRPASDEEQAMCLEFLDEQAARFADKSQLAAFSSGEANAVKPAEDPRQRARENLVHVLFNHNDFLTVR